MESTRSPKDSMKSTWRVTSRDQWNLDHWLIEYLNVYPTDLDKEVPVHAPDEKVPYMKQWSLHVWILFYSAIPLLIHEAYSSYTGNSLNRFAIIALYSTVFNASVIYLVHLLRRLGHTYGFLDGDKPRDGIPDVGVHKVVTSLYKTTVSRIIMGPTSPTTTTNCLPRCTGNGSRWRLVSTASPLTSGSTGITA